MLFVSASFRGEAAAEYEPANRLLMDPVLQFQPWLEFNRRMIRSGRLPLWNGSAGCGAPHLANGQSAVFDPFHLLGVRRAVVRGRHRLDGRVPVVGGGPGDVPAGAFVGARLLGPLVRRAGLSLQRLPGRVAALPGDGRGDLAAVALAGDRSAVPRRRRQGGRLAGDRGRLDRAGRPHPDECSCLAGGRSLCAGTGWCGSPRTASRRRARGLLGARSVPGLGAVRACRSCRWARIWRRARSGAQRQDETRSLVEDRPAAAARHGVHRGSLCLRQPAPGPAQPGAERWA